MWVAWCGLLVVPGVLRLRVAASAGFALACLAWLGWPIWLAPTLATSGGSVPTWATAVHPAFAIDAAVEGPAWTETPTGYDLTPLGQDLPYSMPDSPWPMVATHTILASMLLSIGIARSSLRRRTR